MKRIARFAVLVAAAVLLPAACGPSTTREPTGRGGIVSFGPNITETLFALGAGDRIVGVTDYCDYPPEVAQKTRVGGYLNPDFEKITALAPELIILPGKMEKLAQVAEQNGFKVLHAHMDNLRTIQEGTLAIGRAVERDAQAAELWNRIQRDLDAVRSRVAGKPRVRVLLINTRLTHDLNSIFTVGNSSFVSELTEIAGGENIFNDVATPYFEASKESVVVRAPEVIIEFHAGEGLNEAEQAAYIADWNELDTLPAVRNRRVHLVLESYGLRPGPRLGLVAQRLAELLHPESAAP